MALANVQTFMFFVVFSFRFVLSAANFNNGRGAPKTGTKPIAPMIIITRMLLKPQTSSTLVVPKIDIMASTTWARKNGPSFVNNTLVFKYDPPNSNGGFPHSVYLLPNYWSFIKCDFRRAKRIANPNQGAGEVFEFVLKKTQPYFFASGEHGGIHCNNGTMKFFVMPLKCWPF